MNDGELIVETDGDAWSFTLNRPAKRNALSASLVEALIDGVERAHRANAKLLVFRGAGKSFCARQARSRTSGCLTGCECGGAARETG